MTNWASRHTGKFATTWSILEWEQFSQPCQETGGHQTHIKRPPASIRVAEFDPQLTSRASRLCGAAIALPLAPAI